MEWILIVLLLCIIIVLIVQNYLKQNHTSDFDQSFEYILKQINDIQKSQTVSRVSLNQMEDQMYKINQVMTNTKMRGNWGEYQLDYLLSVYCGQNSNIYSMQYSLPNGKICDCAFHLPDTHKVLCIDSKFPMENYIRLQEDENHLRPFKMNIKKHIDDISNKYINKDTMPYALMFIPSEAIYQYICANCSDLFTYALQNHVFLVSPTTLIAQVMSILSSTKDYYRTTHMEEIEKNILLLQEDVDRLVQRCEKATKTLQTFVSQFELVNTSANKLASKMNKMERDEANDRNIEG